MRNLAYASPLLLAACGVGPYADYGIDATVEATLEVSGGQEHWYQVTASHQVTFTELDDSPTNADLRDSGQGSWAIDATRTSGTGRLRVELIYWACSLNVFEIGPPRQGGIGTLDDDGTLTLTHDLDFIGATSLGLGDGAPENCAPGDEPVAVLGLRLVPEGDSVWTVDAQAEVGLQRSYPEKYWEVSPGTLDLLLAPSTQEEMGWVAQLSAPTDTGSPVVDPAWSGRVLGVDGRPVQGAEVCAEVEGRCSDTDADGNWSIDLPDYPAGSLHLRDFVIDAAGHAPSTTTWFALLGPVTPVDHFLLTDAQRSAAHDAAGTTPDPARGDVLVRVQNLSLQPMTGVALVRHGGAGPVVSLDDDGEPRTSPATGPTGFAMLLNVPPGRFGIAGPAPLTCNPAAGHPGETGRADVYVRPGVVSEVTVQCY